MGQHGVNIRGFMVADTTEGYGIFRIVVDYTDKAIDLLKTNHFTVSETDVLAVKIPDRFGALYEVLKNLSENGLNVEYIYAVANSVIIIKIDDVIKAAKIMAQSHIKVLENTLEI
jgi:hypothetical protein